LDTRLHKGSPAPLIDFPLSVYFCTSPPPAFFASLAKFIASLSRVNRITQEEWEAPWRGMRNSPGKMWGIWTLKISFVCCSYVTDNVQETYNRKKEKVTKKLRKEERIGGY
jgi:hypothetical protein